MGAGTIHKNPIDFVIWVNYPFKEVLSVYVEQKYSKVAN